MWRLVRRRHLLHCFVRKSAIQWLHWCVDIQKNLEQSVKVYWPNVELCFWWCEGIHQKALDEGSDETSYRRGSSYASMDRWQARHQHAVKSRWLIDNHVHSEKLDQIAQKSRQIRPSKCGPDCKQRAYAGLARSDWLDGRIDYADSTVEIYAIHYARDRSHEKSSEPIGWTRDKSALSG